MARTHGKPCRLRSAAYRVFAVPFADGPVTPIPKSLAHSRGTARKKLEMSISGSRPQSTAGSRVFGTADAMATRSVRGPVLGRRIARPMGLQRRQHRLSLRGAKRRSNLDRLSTTGARLLRFARNDGVSRAEFIVSSTEGRPEAGGELGRNVVPSLRGAGRRSNLDRLSTTGARLLRFAGNDGVSRAEFIVSSTEGRPRKSPPPPRGRNTLTQ